MISLKHGNLNQFAAKPALSLARRPGAGAVCMGAVHSTLSQPNRLRTLIAEVNRDRPIDADALDDDDPLGWLESGNVGSVITASYRFATRHPHGAHRHHDVQQLDTNVASMRTLHSLTSTPSGCSPRSAIWPSGLNPLPVLAG